MSPAQQARVAEVMKYVSLGLQNGRLTVAPGSTADLETANERVVRFTVDLRFAEPSGEAVTDVVSRPPSLPAEVAL